VENVARLYRRDDVPDQDWLAPRKGLVLGLSLMPHAEIAIGVRCGGIFPFYPKPGRELANSRKGF
jgi:hypothetical protein